MLRDVLSKMCDLPHLGRVRGGSDDGSPPKCVRPLAGGLLLQPGHRESFSGTELPEAGVHGRCKQTMVGKRAGCVHVCRRAPGSAFTQAH
jgi:hypothetical protein